MRRILVIFFLTLLAAAQVMAATDGQRRVFGQVTFGGETIVGATVAPEGNYRYATATDFDGNFELYVPADVKAIVVSYIGCERAVVPIPAEGGPINVVLYNEGEAPASASAATSATSASAPSRTDGKLRFRPDGTFKILQFTDLHYKTGKSQSETAIKTMEQLITQEEPDMVIITGDLVYSEGVAEALAAITEPLVNSGIPWAFVFGNHDTQFELDNAAIYDILQSTPGALMPRRGKGVDSPDYAIEVKSSTGDDVASVLYCLDSHAAARMADVGRYDWMSPEQVGWYRDLSWAYSQRAGGKVIPSLMFFHIPVPEVAYAYDGTQNAAYGNKKENICAPELNSGMFAAARDTGDIIGMFFGHDHDNDFAVTYYDILLAYGRYSGGNTVYNHLGKPGARVIKLREGSRDVETYLRLLDTPDPVDHVTHPADFKGKRKKK